VPKLPQYLNGCIFFTYYGGRESREALGDFREKFARRQFGMICHYCQTLDASIGMLLTNLVRLVSMKSLLSPCRVMELDKEWK